jgi:hypothetical protein
MKLVLIVFFVAAAQAATFQVGPGRSYAKWCDAVAAAADGDTIEIDGGNTYADDACVVRQNNLTIRGVGTSRPVLRNSFLAVAQSTGKATMVATGTNLTVDGIEFVGPSGAADNCVDPGDGNHWCAGSMNAVRIEGAANHKFTLRNSLVHFVEMGVLSSLDLPGDAEILIENSEFADNCVSEWSPGYVHNVYINPVGKFTFRYNYSHRCSNGILVKSRAAESWILYNRLTDEVTADQHLYFPAGYPANGAGVPDACKVRLSQGLDCTFDLEPDYYCFGSGGWCYSGANNALQCGANAGHCYVIGNLFQQGPHSANPTIVKYADEGQELKSIGQDFYFVNNTVVNEQKGAADVNYMITAGYPGISNIDVRAKIFNNVFYRPGKTADFQTCIQNTSSGIVSCDERGNIYTSIDQFVDRANYDYHLRPDSSAIDIGIDPGTTPAGASLVPTLEYAFPVSSTPRPVNGPIDAGAFEFVASAAPAIVPANLPSAVTGRPYSYQFQATGARTPVSWTASGLPPWITLDPGGLLHGTPSAAGLSTIHVTAKCASGADTRDFSLRVRSAFMVPRPKR